MKAVPNWDRLALLVAAVAVIASAMVAGVLYERLPHIEDDFANFWQAQVMAQGRIYLESPEEAGSFLVPFVVDHQGRRFGKYPPGWPALLSLGARLDGAWLVNPVLAGLGAWLTYRLASKVVGKPVGLLAEALLITSPMFLMLSGTFLSHNMALVLGLTFSLSWLDLFLPSAPLAARRRTVLLASLAGTSLGLLALTRPLTAVGLGLPFAGHGVYLLVRRRFRTALPLAWIGILAAGVAAVQLLWQAGLTGDPKANLYTLWWSYDKVGFGPGYGVTQSGHNLQLAWVNTRHSLYAGLHDIFGWPYLSWIFLPAGLWALRRNRRAFAPVLVFPSLVLVYAAYWIGAWLLGPRYYYEGLPGLALASAAGAGWLAGWPGGSAPPWRRLALTGLLGLLLAVNLSMYQPVRLGGLRGLYSISRARLAPLQSSELGRALVFVEADHWTEYGNLLVLNPPFSRSSLRVAWSRGAGADLRVRQAFPGWAVYRYDPDRPFLIYRVRTASP